MWVDLFPSEHTVSPDNYFANAANGTHNFAISSNVTGGVGPFTYSWTWESGGVNMVISNATSAACDVASTGTNVQNTGVIKCTVIDTGNGNLSRSGTGTVDVVHGTPA